MKTLLAVLKIFPLVLAAVRAVEEAIPQSGQGKQKLDLVLDVLKTAYESGNEVTREFSWGTLVSIVVPMIAKIVGVHNELGLFVHSQPKANQG